MSDTSQLLSEALTAEFVAHRNAFEAVLNRVSSIVAQSQVTVLQLTDEVHAVQTDVRTLQEDMQRLEAHLRTLLEAVSRERAA